MQCVAQRGLVARPVRPISSLHCPRARPSLLTLAVSCPGNNTSAQSKPQHSAAWAQKFVRATVVATTLQFFAAASQAANASIGGGIGAGGGNGGGGGGGGGGGDGHSSMSHGGSPTVLGDIAEASSDLIEEVVLLDVGGMKCGGCVGHVKKILEEQPGVTSASVNLATETALVRVLVPRGSKSGGGGAAAGGALAALGEKLAQALTDAGFTSKRRDPDTSSSSLAAALAAKRAAKVERLRAATVDLAVAWGLAAVCGLGHLAHAWAGAPAWMHALHSVPLNAALSAAALLGPGREIMAQGLKALAAGRPDMNTLVGLGAGASFGVSCVAAALPALGWKTFFEEPAMLLGFVLIGRALEERAKLQASADMAALQELVPTKARLLLGGGKHSEVPAEAVGAGDLLVVLPGDRVPVDGTVVGGRSAVDESALTGEPLPLTKTEGDKVTAGTVNCDGAITVRAEHSGQQTVIADIVRMVEAAQARTAPIQRLADTVAGKFAYGVMGLSAATFAFWATVGTRLFPQVLAGAAAGPAGTLLLSLQMACNVLVTACPCALGLATPTAVLVGTGAGARRGLLIRGGDILEATSHVDTVVFDKTGTLTVGKPQVTHVHSLMPADADTHLGADALLQLAAAVERRTTHPVALALVRAADRLHPETSSSSAASGAAAAAAASSSAAERDGGATASTSQPGSGSGSGSGSENGHGHGHGHGQQLDLSVVDGSFIQEPGSGVAAVVGGRRVAVGTLDWLQRQGADVAAAEGALAAYGADGAAFAKAGAAAVGEDDLDFSEPGASSTSTAAAAAAVAAAVASGSSSSSGVQGLGNSHSRVYVSVDGALAGVIDVADAVRQDARETVDRLHKQGIRTVMLSGDKPAAAAEVAAAVGIAGGDVFADVKPAGKKAVVEALKAEGRTVAMVGDGINDTAALAAADVGVAMGGGVDAASEVAAVVLMGDQLSQVADAVHLAKRTLAKINQNLVWAFGYNVVAIPLAAGALLPSAGVCLTPSISGALMGLSSLAVVSNSLLLQWEVRNMGQPHGHGHGHGHAQQAAAVQPQVQGSQQRVVSVAAATGAQHGSGQAAGADGDGAAGASGAATSAASSRGAPQMLASVVSSAAAAAATAAVGSGGGGKQPPQAPPAIGGAAGAGAG
ncbi:hypothetical protein HYH02_010314 [Chlamydomonas schloesseri]|uniref:HMA domain-containing protein n=1 Tax=Chlamydomonas schloesseri TaxID=2026947 RepID=A0A835W7T5_9CHLO|nr:hypothetical protein HYH02_010314 [Chlamydomonas schloesseri]|eukprot:KAG2440429.1 hypothetical protein HYH02_010314 [Chlamydomonas schloesseri]